MARVFALAVCLCALAGCASNGDPSKSRVERPRPAEGVLGAGIAGAARPVLDSETALRNFREAVARVEPVAEALCREMKGAEPGFPCDVRIVVDRRVDVPPNAFQTFDEAGRPTILFNVPFIATARNQDEVAFVFGHEMGHLIGEHLAKLRDGPDPRARLAEVAVAGSGEAATSGQAPAGAAGGAHGRLTYRQSYELEADLIGAEIAERAGYDPELGILVIARHTALPDDAPARDARRTHPATAERIAAIESRRGS